MQIRHPHHSTFYMNENQCVVFFFSLVLCAWILHSTTPSRIYLCICRAKNSNKVNRQQKKGEELKFFRRICRGVHSSHSCVCSGIYSSYTLYSWRKNSVWRAIAMSSAIYILHEWSRTKEAAEANSRKNITNTIGKRQLNNNTTRNIIKKEENRTIYDWNKTKKKTEERRTTAKKSFFSNFLVWCSLLAFGHGQRARIAACKSKKSWWNDGNYGRRGACVQERGITITTASKTCKQTNKTTVKVSIGVETWNEISVEVSMQYSAMSAMCQFPTSQQTVFFFLFHSMFGEIIFYYCIQFQNKLRENWVHRVQYSLPVFANPISI